ncbi:MAG TPA: peptidase C14, partial [Achromobacter sp.]|nr:peptidase C14 [Achromobacter sp.]
AALDLLDLRVRMGEPLDPREWAAVLQDVTRNPMGMALPGMPPIQGLPDTPWMRALGVRPAGQP